MSEERFYKVLVDGASCHCVIEALDADLPIAVEHRQLARALRARYVREG